jgi:hypothetical protein
MAPLHEPTLFGDDKITQKMLENGSLHRDTEEMQQQMNHVYSTLKIPLVKKENILTASEANNLKFCGSACKDEAKKQLLPLLLSIQSNAAPIQKSKQLSSAARKTFGILSRILARASTDPNLVLTTMSTYVLELSNSTDRISDFCQYLSYIVSKYLNGQAEVQLSDAFSLLQELFPEHRPCMLCYRSVLTTIQVVLMSISICATGFSAQVFARFVSAVNLNSFEYNIFPSSLGISADESDESNWRFRVAPEITKEKVITGISLCAVGSMLNHSCDPNVISRIPFSRVMTWVAAKEISEGDEVVISYLGETDASTDERKKSLLDLYEFECNCPKCKADM